jgi:hypothetical protein
MKEVFRSGISNTAMSCFQALCVSLTLDEASNLPKWGRIGEIDAKFAWVIGYWADCFSYCAGAVAAVLKIRIVCGFKIIEIEHSRTLVSNTCSDNLTPNVTQRFEASNLPAHDD